MENKDEKIMNKEENDDDDEWESIPENEKTEETKDVLYRLNIEGASKVKLDLHKMKNYHSIKVKRLDQKEIESFHELDKYIKDQYLPNISLNNNNNSNPYITILNNDYLIKNHPEIGSCLIYEMDDINQEAKLLGKSDTWYEATVFKPKIVLRKPNNNKSQNNPKINKTLNLIKKIKTEKVNKNENKGNLKFLMKKRKKKKRKKIKYPKDSTIIEIKRIIDNKDKIEEDIKNNSNEDKIINLKEPNLKDIKKD